MYGLCVHVFGQVPQHAQRAQHVRPQQACGGSFSRPIAGLQPSASLRPCQMVKQYKEKKDR